MFKILSYYTLFLFNFIIYDNPNIKNNKAVRPNIKMIELNSYTIKIDAIVIPFTKEYKINDIQAVIKLIFFIRLDKKITNPISNIIKIKYVLPPITFVKMFGFDTT